MMSRRGMVLGAGALTAAGIGGWAGLSRPDYAAAASEVWQDLPRPADPDLAWLVHYGRLAANSHNTQPWTFARDGDDVLIRSDRTRRTPVVDPDDHHLYASLGCAAENLALAARSAGRPADIASDPAAGGAIRVSLGHGPAMTDPLFSAITQRQCTRSDYDGTPVSAADLDVLTSAAGVAGGEVMLITAPVAIEQLLSLIIDANTRQIADPAFVAELRHWLRFNAQAAMQSGDGLYAGCSGNPRLPTWAGNAVFSRVLTAKGEMDKIARQVRTSAGFAVFVSGGNGPAHWMTAGRSYQRFALAATALGLKHAFLNQPLEDAQTRPKLAALLGLGDQRPDLIVRFGRAAPMPRALRRPVADVIVPA